MEFLSLFPKNMPNLLDRFNRMEYVDAFAEYRRISHPFMDTLALTEDIPALARAAVSALDENVRGLWKKRQLCDQRYFLILYVSPMLLEEGTEKSKAFLSALREAWQELHPKLGYEIASYGELSSAFNDTIMGFKIGGKT